MSRSEGWMPLFVKAYLDDTGTLNLLQHGAYLRLLMHYWCNGPLENDDEALAAILGIEVKTWRGQIASKVRRFFMVGSDGLLHQKRIDRELSRASEISEKRRAAAIASHNGHGGPRGNGGANAPANADASAVDNPANAPANGGANAGAKAVSKAANAGASAPVHLVQKEKNILTFSQEKCAREPNPANSGENLPRDPPAAPADTFDPSSGKASDYPLTHRKRDREVQMAIVTPPRLIQPKHPTPEELAAIRQRAGYGKVAAS